jgi:hypothetical protein
MTAIASAPTMTPAFDAFLSDEAASEVAEEPGDAIGDR